MTFNAFTTLSTGAGPLVMATADLNADGKLDLIYANHGTTTISVCMGNGKGTFAAAVNYTVGSAPSSVAAGDLNGDGRLDLAVTNLGFDDISVLLNNGNGTFAAAVNYPTGDGARQCALADLNADGRLDLAVANQSAGTVSILLNSGGGAFAPKVDYNLGPNAYGMGISDFDTEMDVTLIKEEGESAWLCPNCVCGAQDLQKMIFHVSKEAMDIDGFGKSNVERFYELGWQRDISDVYCLDYDSIASLDGFGKRSADKIKASVEKAKQNPIQKLLHSLSIHHLGKRACKLIAEQIIHVLDLQNWEKERFLEIKDIGPVSS